MKRINTGRYPAGRLQVGAAILAAAAAVDITVVRRRFLAFSRAQRRYQDAHEAVETAAAALRAQHTRLTAAAQDEAVERLAAALALDGEPRRNPFAALGLGTPSSIERLRYGEKAKALRQLAAAVRQRPQSNPGTRRAADAVDEAATAMEEGLPAVEKLQAQLDATRSERETCSQDWDKAMATFKHDVLAASATEAPGLNKRLFGRNRPKGKAGAGAPTVPEAANAASPQTAAPAAETTTPAASPAITPPASTPADTPPANSEA